MLRWEKAQVEAKLERLEGTEDKLDLGDLAEVKTPRRPGENVGKSHYEVVDSEDKIQSPTVNAYVPGRNLWVPIPAFYSSKIG